MGAARAWHLPCMLVDAARIRMRVDAVHVIRAPARARRLAGVCADEGPGVGSEVQLVSVISQREQ